MPEDGRASFRRVDMRVVHVISTLSPDTGGPPRVAMRLAASQASQGHDVTVVSYDDPPVRPKINDMVRMFPAMDRVEQVYLPSPVGLDFFTGTRAYKSLRPIVGKADVVHIHNIWESLLRGAARAAFASGVPYVIQPNGMLDPWALEQKWFKKQVALVVAYRAMINGASRLVIGHQQEADLIAPLKLKPPVFIAPLNGVFPEELGTQVESSTKHFPKLGDAPYIVFMGRFHFKKGLDILAEAFAIAARIHPLLRLVMIGIDDGAEADFRQRIKGHDLSDRVDLLGPLHGEAKWEVLRGAQAFLLPSRQEGFSVAIIEAMASGLPVLISDDCHFREVDAASAGMSLPLKIDAFAQAITKIVGDVRLRQTLSAGARVMANNTFNFHEAGKKVLEMYGTL
jgi:glycosyltransferase involved in cell wall biosynthesis